MKILFDQQIFLSQRNGGISRFFCNLISHLNQISDTESFLPIANCENEYLKEFEHILNPKFAAKKFPFNLFDKNQNARLMNEFLQSQNFDIFHPTYYDDYFFKNLGNKPFVTTIHDMTYEIFPEFFSIKDKTSQLKIESAQKASKIIVVSNNTKKDLLKLTDLKEEKIVVIPPACSLDVDSIIVEKPTRNYLLYVGTRGIYKNFYFMVHSIAEILKDSPDLHLLCFGQAFNKKEMVFLENLGLGQKVKTVSGNDQILIELYKNALAFIAPSYCEGFYVTLLEAFACGCPTIACNKEPIPEVAGDAVIYFEAKDNISIRDNVDRVISDKSLRDNLIAKGFTRNQLFSWPEIAKKTRQVYESVL